MPWVYSSTIGDDIVIPSNLEATTSLPHAIASNGMIAKVWKTEGKANSSASLEQKVTLLSPSIPLGQNISLPWARFTFPFAGLKRAQSMHTHTSRAARIAPDKLFAYPITSGYRHSRYRRQPLSCPRSLSCGSPQYSRHKQVGHILDPRSRHGPGRHRHQ
jgi:hypothetical protein